MTLDIRTIPAKGQEKLQVLVEYWHGRGYDPYRALWGELFVQLVKDYHSLEKSVSDDARDFLNNEDRDFEYIVNSMDMDFEKVRDMILKNIDTDSTKLIKWFRTFGED